MNLRLRIICNSFNASILLLHSICCAHADESLGGLNHFPDRSTFDDTVIPFLRLHCVKRQSESKQEAGLQLDSIALDFGKRSVASCWSDVIDRMNAGEMPPPGDHQPNAEQATPVVEWIIGELRRREAAINSTGGRVAMRRMNRAKYNNTIRDLIGIDFQPANSFPDDPPDFGFDNFGAAQEDASYRKSDIQLELIENTETKVKLKRQDNRKAIELQAGQPSDADQQVLRQRRGAGSQSADNGSDWTRFRGPGGSCVSADKNIPTEWSTTKNLAWKLQLPGPGASSPVTWRDRVYITCYTGYGIDADAPGDIENLERHLLCIRRTDGELLWKATMRSKAPVHAYDGSLLEHGYATHTPTVDQDGVYVFYGSSGALSYTHAGTFRWQTSCGTTVSGYGSASSPILFENVLIVSAHIESESIIGLDTRNGRQLWRVEAARPIWCTPIIARHGDKAELVFFQEKKYVAGLNPANGRKLWSFQTSPYDVQRVEGSQVKYKDAIITLQGSWGSNSFRFGGTGNVTDSHRQWKSPGILGIPLVFKDQLISTFKGGVRISDAKTAKSIELFRLNPSKDGYASAVIADDKLYRVYQEDGVCVVQLGQEPKQIAHNVIEGDTSFFNATPAISNGQLFLRSDKLLYCIEKK